MSVGWYLTAPWSPMPERRGDALGFRAGADYFADLIAPGISNGTSDGRWVTLLSWCLKWSHIAWHQASNGDLSGRDAQRARYAWLRPLELLWVDRTLASGQTTGQLRGRRSVERWRKSDRKSLNFDMSDDQFRRYRQVGTYGAYRVIFRSISGLTTGDGWTLTQTGHQLADLVNKSLPREVRLKQESFENGTKWGHWADMEARFWVEHGWSSAVERTDRKNGYHMLPTPDDAIDEVLPEEERSLLELVLFSADSTRRVTAEVLAGAKDVKSHAELCDILASSSRLAAKIAPASLAPLPAFTRLADAAMDVMRTLWNEINQDTEDQAPTFEKLTRSDALPKKFKLLNDASRVWLAVADRKAFPHERVATQLAQAQLNAGSLTDQIKALTKHHHEHGGGRLWFHEKAGKVKPLVPATGIAASDYRFRMRSICLLAAQCGVGNMDRALIAARQAFEEDTKGDLA